MKKITANIQLIHEGIKQVTGYYTEVKLETGEIAEVLIHRNPQYPNSWTVSEFTTGVSITPYYNNVEMAKTRTNILNVALEYVNRRLKESGITLHEHMGNFLKSTNLNYVN
jgi:hypothetical protein